MPELPEVETIVRSVAPHLAGRTILRAHFYSRRVTRGDFVNAASSLAGAIVQKVRRRGKQIFIDLDRGVLYVHLGMTGKLLWNGEAGKYTRAVLELNGGTLLYDDIRQFGRVEFFKALPEVFSRTGPDALDVDFEEFYARLQRHSGRIKPLLLNQSFLGGVGNIYADELLFAAGVHPLTAVARLSKKRAGQLFQKLQEVLRSAIEHRGSSISDYVDTAGEPGRFQELHCVYGRVGEPCPRCGKPVRRITVSQRGTHYCPRCQRA